MRDAFEWLALADGRPYPRHRWKTSGWRRVPPCLVDIAELAPTQSHVRAECVVRACPPVSGDEFPHVVEWDGLLYVEDGHHRVVRAIRNGMTRVAVRVRPLRPPNPGVSC